MVRKVLLTLILLFTAEVYADVVVLRSGHRIEGEVVELNGRIEVRLPYGSIFFRKEEVLRIERRLTPWQEFKERLKGVDGDDWRGLRELLLWCKRKGLREEAERVSRLLKKALRAEFKKRKERAGRKRDELKRVALWCEEMGLKEESENVMAEYWRIYIDERLESVDRSDAKALVLLALRLRMECVPKVHLRIVFEMALLADPDCVEARIGIGMQLFEGRWLYKSQVDAILERRYDERMARSGYVFHGGKWVLPDALAVMEKEKRLKRLEEELNAERKRLRQKEADLMNRERRIREDERRLADERRRYREAKRRYEEELRSKERIIKDLRYENWRLMRWVRQLQDENERLRRKMDDSEDGNSDGSSGGSRRRER